MKFELLGESNAQQLLDFEVSNRQFFESVIAPRDEAFYSRTGIHQHICDFTALKHSVAFVLTEQNRILARANIRNITSGGEAEIGYRVSEGSTGRGIGAKCVSFLVEQARSMELNHLHAYVMNNNLASEKVLLKNGFSLHICLPNHYNHMGKQLHGFKYQRQLLC